MPQVAGVREALAACRVGDILVVTTVDRLARSIRDARDTVRAVEMWTPTWAQ
ncbi:recombinase family protein [Streptomyces sp. NPDC057486]|uniref:recombinase family protein n=1 Tax=Streptomyces sp. NPDC057486 TaxID=3346145 RepID=UPI003697A69B